MPIIKIEKYDDHHRDKIINLITHIQETEFHMPITAVDREDLERIPDVYINTGGNFWVATHDHKVIGTVALRDIGNAQGVLRKMFVAESYRGHETNIAQILLNTAVDWCEVRKIKQIYLATTDQFKAAHKFYERNDFEKIAKEKLPATFPVAKLDSRFYVYKV